MKKTHLLFSILIGISILSSCSNNGDDGNNELIIGTWSGVSSTFDGVDGGIPLNNIVKFTSNNRTEFIGENLGANGTDVVAVGSWSKNGNTLTITFDDAEPLIEDSVFKILELNETNLEWETTSSGLGTLVERFQR